jgi:hypothetical protein
MANHKASSMQQENGEQGQDQHLQQAKHRMKLQNQAQRIWVPVFSIPLNLYKKSSLWHLADERHSIYILG